VIAPKCSLLNLNHHHLSRDTLTLAASPAPPSTSSPPSSAHAIARLAARATRRHPRRPRPPSSPSPPHLRDSLPRPFCQRQPPRARLHVPTPRPACVRAVPFLLRPSFALRHPCPCLPARRLAVPLPPALINPSRIPAMATETVILRSPTKADRLIAVLVPSSIAKVAAVMAAAPDPDDSWDVGRLSSSPQSGLVVERPRPQDRPAARKTLYVKFLPHPRPTVSTDGT
jgi:hypothetical protein